MGDDGRPCVPLLPALLGELPVKIIQYEQKQLEAFGVGGGKGAGVGKRLRKVRGESWQRVSGGEGHLHVDEDWKGLWEGLKGLVWGANGEKSPRREKCNSK